MINKPLGFLIYIYVENLFLGAEPGPPREVTRNGRAGRPREATLVRSHVSEGSYRCAWPGKGAEGRLLLPSSSVDAGLVLEPRLPRTRVRGQERPGRLPVRRYWLVHLQRNRAILDAGILHRRQQLPARQR